MESGGFEHSDKSTVFVKAKMIILFNKMASHVEILSIILSDTFM